MGTSQAGKIASTELVKGKGTDLINGSVLQYGLHKMDSWTIRHAENDVLYNFVNPRWLFKIITRRNHPKSLNIINERLYDRRKDTCGGIHFNIDPHTLSWGQSLEI